MITMAVNFEKEKRKIKRRLALKTLGVSICLVIMGLMAIIGFAFVGAIYHEYQHKKDLGEFMSRQEMCLYSIDNVPLEPNSSWGPIQEIIQLTSAQGYLKGDTNPSVINDTEWNRLRVNSEIKAYPLTFFYLVCGFFCILYIGRYVGKGMDMSRIEAKKKLKATLLEEGEEYGY